MKTHKLLSETGKKVGMQVLAALLAWAMMFTPAVAAAQYRVQARKATSPVQPQPAPATKLATESPTQEAKSDLPGGPHEGIKVHGHWVIEVRDPYGSLVTRREFNNALVDGGQVLSALLARTGIAGRWVVFLAATTGTSPCQGGTGATFPDVCGIFEPAASNPTGGNAESRNLTVTRKLGTVTLAGSITALANGTIGRVFTELGVCTTSTAFADCNFVGGPPFTDAILAPPFVPVVAGQIIQVTVTFSFS